MFGDSYVHQSENLQQLRGYVNRFGPGMVIYWFGFVETLNSDPDVLLVDAFPDDIHLTAQPQDSLCVADAGAFFCVVDDETDEDAG